MGPPDSHRVPRAPRYSGLRYASRVGNYGTLTLYGLTFQTVRPLTILQRRAPTTPAGPEPRRFGLCPFRSPLLRVSRLFSLPPGTKMFQFPGFASAINADDSTSYCRVSPFGHPRVTGRLHLAAAFRSLPRPSSPSRA